MNEKKGPVHNSLSAKHVEAPPPLNVCVWLGTALTSLDQTRGKKRRHIYFCYLKNIKIIKLSFAMPDQMDGSGDAHGVLNKSSLAYVVTPSKT